jgi:coproporphyrinogen III oxidase-like Fe-S oxidoreductase
LTQQNKMEEEFMLGLRTMKGVDRSLFERKFNQTTEAVYQEELDTLLDRQLIKLEDNHIRLTKKGVFLGNEVFRSFLKDT